MDKNNNNTTAGLGHNGGPPIAPLVTPEEHAILAENRNLGVRLTLAHAFTDMWLRAYDALLHHGINVRELPEYKNQVMLDDGLASDLHQGQSKIVEWIKRVGSGIDAAVRRKGFKKV